MAHVLLEVASAILALLPLVAIAIAYRRTGSPRLAWALAAFTVLEARLVITILLHTVIPVAHVTEEMIEFGGDLVVVAAFAAAFLYGVRWSIDGSPTRAA